MQVNERVTKDLPRSIKFLSIPNMKSVKQFDHISYYKQKKGGNLAIMFSNKRIFINSKMYEKMQWRISF